MKPASATVSSTSSDQRSLPEHSRRSRHSPCERHLIQSPAMTDGHQSSCFQVYSGASAAKVVG